MAKQLNQMQVNLTFTADTHQAKAQLQNLQNQLTQVINTPTAGLGSKMTAEINQAAHAAAELKVHLQNATNIQTGNLDFTKLNQSIKNSGTSLSEYAAKLQSIGPAGQKAFMLLAQSVASAEVPIRRSNALLSSLWTTMKNTARWQLTSSMLHGFIGAASSALRYTQDLNESLNNIRIVTGKSIDEMADFAKEANKAAKALSTTTTKYTDASLIFYQQGLNTEEVKKRTDVVIKMANAAGQSVETVSDQLTAVWNNFYDGTKSLEYYADVMTALGAATASSTDEIAGGLEKFAAIGETIGLSYEYAASALATITANTRQSEDVVGTALKTIFARVQGLNLGETLDDGTTLNKYSEALAKVGISIFDQAGELKDMDNILDEMGSKWETLNKAQQTALAQTVAGTRQYTQLVALMDNWNKGDNDSMQANLDTAYGSTGTLQEQADIYAESWQAARDEVKAALEGLYDSLLNDEAFIDILNVIEHIVSGIEGLVDSMGGLGGTIMTIGAIMTNVFRKQFAQSISQATYSLMSWTETGRKKIQQEKMNQFSQMLQNAKIGDTERQILEAQFKSYQQLTEKAKDLTDLEQQTYQILLDQQKARGQLALQKEQELKAEQAKQTDMRNDLKYAIGAYGPKGKNEKQKYAFSTYEKLISNVKTAQTEFDNAQTDTDKDAAYVKLSNAKKNLSHLKNESGLSQYFKDYEKDLEAYEAQVIKTTKKEIEFKDALEDAKKSVISQKQEVDKNTKEKKENAQTTTEVSSPEEKNTQKKKENEQATKEAGNAEDKLKQDIQEEKQVTEQATVTTEKYTQAKKKLSTTDMAKNFASGASAAMSMVSALQSMSSAINVIQSDAKLFDKITSGLMSVLMFGSMAAMSLKSLNRITTATEETLGQAIANSKGLGKALGDLGGGATTAKGQYFALGGTILFVVAAIAALVGAAKLCVDAYNKEEKAAKKAAEASANAAEALKDATAAHEEFKDSQSGYEEAVNGLRKLTQGTIEYKEQLMKANEQAMKMIESQNLLYGTDYEYDENGLIRFKDKYDNNGKYLGRADEIARTNSFNDMQTVQAGKLLADQQAQNAKTQADLVKFNRETLKTGADHVSFAVEVAAFTAAGAALGTIIPGVGNAIGAAAGALVGVAAGLYEASNTIGASTKQEEKAMSLLAEKYSEIGDAILTEEQIKSTLAGQVDDATINTLIKATQENKDALKTQLSALEANTAALKMTLEATAKSANMSNSKYQSLTSKEQQLADKIVANRVSGKMADTNSLEYKAAEIQALAKWRTETGHTGEMFAGNEDHAYDKYMEITYGKNWRDNYRVTHKAGTNATIEKKNSDGGWQNISSEKNTLSNEDVKNAIVTHYMQQYGAEADEAVMEQLRNVGDTLKKTIANIDDDAIFDVQSALASGSMVDLTLMSPEQIEALQANITNIGDEFRAAIQAGIDNYSEYAYEMRVKTEADSILSGGAKELEINKSSLEAYSEELMKNNEALYSNAKLAAEAAVEHFRFSKALDKLEGIVKDNIDIIKKADKESLNYYESLGAVQEALIETFGLDVGSEFVETNIDKIKSASEGSAEDIKKLGLLISKEYVDNLEVASDNINAFFSKDKLGVDEAVVIGDNVFYNLDEFEQYFSTTKDRVIDYINQIAASGLTIGESLNGTVNVESFVNDLNQMAIATNMSVEDMNSMLSNMGVQAKVESTWVPGPVQVPRYRITEKQVSGDTFGNRVYETYTEELEPETIEDSGRMVASISYDGSNPSTDIKYVGAKQALTTSSTKSNTSSSKKSQPTTKSNVVDRYKEENDQLDDLSRAYDKASKAADRLYGTARLNKMKENNKLLKNEYDLLMDKAKRGREEYLEEDRAHLKDAAKKAGVKLEIKFDKNDNITNYEEIMNPLYEELRAAEKAGGETPSDTEQERIDEIQSRIDLLKGAISQFDDTREEIEDIEDEAEEKLDEWYQNNFDQLNYKLELEIEFDEQELKELDYQLSKIEDDFYSMDQAFVLMNKQMDVYEGALQTYTSSLDNLKKSLEAGDITQAQYVEGLKNLQDQAYDSIEAINDLDKQMSEYYENTLSAADEELEDYTDHLEHLTGVFDHYLSLMSLLGREKDYDAMGNFLQGKASSIENELAVQSDYYEMLLAQKATKQAAYDTAVKSGNKEAIEQARKELDAITDAADGAQEKVLSLTENWVDAMKAVIENDLAKAADSLEKSLTNGLGFETLMNGFDKLNARQEEYLTKTNQIYETNKMMRTAQQALDKTDNAVSKQKIKNFINETKALQENSKLSNYELSIQQAKYDLLVAEMALEEAKNAKSTVRLQRDSEGNFGYVYTADQDKVADAEQNFADAQNKLYNVSLEGQQEYTEKFLQAQQSMYDELTELHSMYLNGDIATEEEYNLRKEQILSHYINPNNGILTQYSELYNIAVQADSAATADYWAKDYGAMTQNSADWKEAVNTYLGEVNVATNEWKIVQEEANKKVKGALNNSEKATKDLLTESQNLTKFITGTDGLIDAIGKEIDKVNLATDAYYKERDSILAVKEAYEEYLATLGTEIKTNNGTGENGGGEDPAPNPPPPPTTTPEEEDPTVSNDPIKTEEEKKTIPGYDNGELETWEVERLQNWINNFDNNKNNDIVVDGKYGDNTAAAASKVSGETFRSADDAYEWFKNDYEKKNSKYWFKIYLGDSDNGELITWGEGNGYNSAKDAIEQGKVRANVYGMLNKVSVTATNVKPTQRGIGWPTYGIKKNVVLEASPNAVQGYKLLNNGTIDFNQRWYGQFADRSDVIQDVLYQSGNWYYKLKDAGRWYTAADLSSIGSYDTGGYTGQWGPEGKLAMLHQKELVLNADDTSNILQTVGFIRDVVSMIDHNASVSSIGSLFSIPAFNTGGSGIEQDIKIYAEFPSATNHTEIEEAFNNLLNTASQYANRKN